MSQTVCGLAKLQALLRAQAQKFTCLTMKTNSKTIVLVLSALMMAALSSAGCTKPWKTPKMFSLDNTWPFRDKDKPHEGTPVRMVSTWTNTVLTQQGQKPQRGFGGRIMFYEKDEKNPVLVDGQLVVYAFDEADRDPTNNKPTRRYVFPADQMPLHMSKSDMGASYSFWLPWDEAGGPRTEVSLICRFEPKNGGVITGEQTRQPLPGPAPVLAAKSGGAQTPKVPDGVPSRPPKQTLETMQINKNDQRNAQLINYESPIPNQQAPQAAGPVQKAYGEPEKHLMATTITLPQSYQMPDAAALNAAMQMGYQQPQMQVAPQQFAPNSVQWQTPVAAARPYSAPMQPAVQPAPYTHPSVGIQQRQPITTNVPANMLPPRPATFAAQPTWNNGAAQQNPQQQIQQQPVQQPYAEPNQVQYAPAQQMAPAMQPWQQPQTVPVTALNYPAQGQLAR
jgi:hypothetical protein